MNTLHPTAAPGAPGAPGQADRRAETRGRLAAATYDLLVIGGGILGTSVAWHAAQSGLRVAMVDAGDFAGATSSASSKLVHGGLRYLQTGAVRLVAENHHERRVLARDVAPHLVNPLTFYLPVYKGGPHGAVKLGAGVFAYSALSAFGDGVGRLISPAKAAAANPALRTDNLKAVAVYGDHQMNDARVAVMTVRAAAQSGAVVLNHAEVTGLRFTGGRVTGADLKDRIDGTEFGVDARLVLNATGPWVDHLRRMENPDAMPSVRLSKGAHLVLRRSQPWGAAMATPVDKYRITFALPWEDMLLLGTTDERYEGDPADVRATEADIDQILAEAAFSVRDEALDRSLMTYAFAGLRVLPGGPGGVESAKRETVVTEGAAACCRWPAASGPPTGTSAARCWPRWPSCRACRWAGTWSRSPTWSATRRCPASPTPTRSRTACSSTASRASPSTRRRPVTWPPTTARWPSTSPTSSTRTRPSASASTPTAPRSGRRSSTRAITSGRRPPTTCCAAARR